MGQPIDAGVLRDRAGSASGRHPPDHVPARGGGCRALNFIGRETLFGRYWGCTEDHPFLHFETCYYQAIDAALALGLSRVGAGAQGAHKLARGYLPTATYSLHYITDPNFRNAVSDYLRRERRRLTKRSNSCWIGAFRKATMMAEKLDDARREEALKALATASWAHDETRDAISKTFVFATS